jgi:hypothetical protein
MSSNLHTIICGRNVAGSTSHPISVSTGGTLDVADSVSAAAINKLVDYGGQGQNDMGDGSLRLQTFCYARNESSGQMKALRCDTNGRLECSVDALEVTADTINLSTDTLETKLQSLIDFSGQPNSIGDGSNMMRHMNYGYDVGSGQQRPIKVDNIGKVIIDSPAGSDLCLRLDKIGDGTAFTKLKANSNAAGSGTDYHVTCDSGGRLYVNSDLGLPINALTEGGANQSLRTDGNGSLRVNTDKTFGSVVSLKDNVAISGAYQFNSTAGAVKRGQKITLEVRSESGSTGWTCVIGFSLNGTNWLDTISNINAVPAVSQIVEIDVIAPYWRFVFVNTGVSSNWTIKYV